MIRLLCECGYNGEGYCALPGEDFLLEYKDKVKILFEHDKCNTLDRDNIVA